VNGKKSQNDTYLVGCVSGLNGDRLLDEVGVFGEVFSFLKRAGLGVSCLRASFLIASFLFCFDVAGFVCSSGCLVVLLVCLDVCLVVSFDVCITVSAVFLVVFCGFSSFSTLRLTGRGGVAGPDSSSLSCISLVLFVKPFFCTFSALLLYFTIGAKQVLVSLIELCNMKHANVVHHHHHHHNHQQHFYFLPQYIFYLYYSYFSYIFITSHVKQC